MTTADTSADINLREQIARIDGLIAETAKFTAEQHKLIAEASKFRTERWLLPIVVVAGGLGSFTAAYAAVAALLHIAGH
jgi:hypothetical protein